MNTWIIGGFGSLGLLVFFLASPYGNITNLAYLGFYGSPGFDNPSILILTLFLLGVAGFSFYKGIQETDKKK